LYAGLKIYDNRDVKVDKAATQYRRSSIFELIF